MLMSVKLSSLEITNINKISWPLIQACTTSSVVNSHWISWFWAMLFASSNQNTVKQLASRTFTILRSSKQLNQQWAWLLQLTSVRSTRSTIKTQKAIEEGALQNNGTYVILSEKHSSADQATPLSTALAVSSSVSASCIQWCRQSS